MARERNGASRKATRATEEVEETQAPTEYEVLYRRFRPSMFRNVIGQQHATESLRKMVVNGKVPHALLFSGPRGCGKTTSARILAMALNCEDVTDGEPCGECAFCSGVIQGSATLGVTEMDAASNRSIDGIRSIIETMQVGSIAKRRVYIIDEVHQLTREASSALLKTLEEPPPGVVIILATTDPQKLLPTIVSRTTHLRFHTVEPDDMTGLVKQVAEREGIELTDQQVASVVIEGRGSPRDTLSVLERVASGASAASATLAPEISNAVAQDDVSTVMVSVAQAIKDGQDPIDISSSLISYWRDCLLSIQAPQLLLLPTETKSEVEQVAKALGTRRLIALLNSVAEASNQMRLSSDPRLLLEVALIQSVVPESRGDLDGLYELVEELIEKVERVLVSGPAAPSGNDWPPADDPRLKERDQGAAESAETDEGVRDDADDQDDASEGRFRASEGPDDDQGDDQDDPAPSRDDSATADEVLDEVFEAASKRLRVALQDSEAEFDGDDLIVTTTDDLSNRLYSELEELVEKSGYKLKHKVEG